MKIAIVTYRFIPKTLHRTEISFFYTAKYLAKRGHEVHIITWLDKRLPKNSIEKGFYNHRVFGKNIRLLTPMLFWMNIFIYSYTKFSNRDFSIFFKKIFTDTQIPYLIYMRGSENVFQPSL